ncbi:hypothetical protein IL992_45450 [Microbispora sp. NEAU-D428]|uniref:hypothetical protein n=1 Tax=Microbispora sitophila TaxID=2771537 RepID=UPI001866D4B7|nr:hypothetical protein [Microbispora sitophila]MBE3016340.1 hypothetical protein [Microbispora sitophila]
MEYLVVVVSATILTFLVHFCFDRDTARRVLPVLLLAFATRLLIHVLVLRTGLLPYGGDNYTYEYRASKIVALWEREGFQFVTSDQITDLYSVAVPCNIYALIIYLCGGSAPLACTAVVALVACALCMVMYRFARLIGADERASYRLLVLMAFMPAFLLHTSDMFKDGFNAFCVVACLALATSNVQKFDIRKILLLIPLLWALWNIRPYMVFMCGLPLILGFVASKRVLPLCTLTLLAGFLACLVFFPESTENMAVETMQAQLAQGQSQEAIRANSDRDSGVVFNDGGNPWGALPAKLVYTLLSPFPWTGGSIVLQLGKIETLLWYYLLVRAVQGGRELWRRERRSLMVILLFVLPCTIIYATSMANIGLIFRQRMPIVLVVSLLSALAWTRAEQRRGQKKSQVRSGQESRISSR